MDRLPVSQNYIFYIENGVFVQYFVLLAISTAYGLTHDRKWIWGELNTSISKMFGALPRFCLTIITKDTLDQTLFSLP